MLSSPEAPSWSPSPGGGSTTRETRRWGAGSHSGPEWRTQGIQCARRALCTSCHSLKSESSVWDFLPGNKPSAFRTRSELAHCTAPAQSDPLWGLRRGLPSYNVLSHSPALGSYSLSRREITVDLPEPLGPTSAVMDPAGIERLKSWNMGTSGRAG